MQDQQKFLRFKFVCSFARFLDVLVKEGLSAKLSVSVPDHGEGAERKEDECISGSKGMCGACDVLKMFSKLTDSSSRLNSQGLQVPGHHPVSEEALLARHAFVTLAWFCVPCRSTLLWICSTTHGP